MSPELGPMRSPTILNSEPARRPERMSRSGAPLGGNDDEDRAGCKSAVEIVTRNSQKGERTPASNSPEARGDTDSN